jgi:hypothetical protein
VDVVKSLDCFDLDDNGIADDEIRPMFGDEFPFVIERYANLSLELDSGSRELDAQSSLVD